jgi:glycopeptide antibiotics resistance protein
VAYAVLLALVLLWPNSDRQSGMVLWLSHILTSAGASSAVVTYARLEVVMNAAIVAPLTFLGSWSIVRLRWQDWVAYAFIGAAAVEVVQAIALSTRQASFSDVVANTVGALAGAALFRAVRPMLRTEESD